MLDAVFSFRGRLNRLQYFLRCLALGAAAVVIVILIAVVIGATKDSNPLAGLLVGGLLGFATISAFLWISLSMQVRRIRDIGWPPVYVVPACIAIDVMDQLVARAFPALGIGADHRTTIVGALVNLALAGTLLFWPGRSGDDSTPDSGQAWLRSDEPSPAVAPAPRRTAMAAPARPMTQPNAGFGRRGL